MVPYLDGVDWSVEKTLQLWGPGVQNHDLADSGLLEHVGHQFSSDGHTVVVLVISLTVEKQRHHHRDGSSGRQPKKRVQANKIQKNALKVDPWNSNYLQALTIKRTSMR